MLSQSRLAKKGKGVRQDYRHRGVVSQVEGSSSSQHRPHEPSNMHLFESSPAGTQVVAPRKQEYTPFNPALQFSSATPAEIATINDACEGRKVKSAAFICRLFEEIQKRVKEDDWVNVAALGMRHLPAMISLQRADGNTSLHGQPHAQQTMGLKGLDEVEIASEDLDLIIVWHRRNSKGLSMKGVLPMISWQGGGESLTAGQSRSLLGSQGEPSDDPKPGLSYAWTITDSESDVRAGMPMYDEYRESDEDEEIIGPGMKGTVHGPAGMIVTPDASEEVTTSNMGITQLPASVASGVPTMDISQGTVRAGPDLSVEEATIGMETSQEPASVMPNGLLEGFFSLRTLWKTLESLSS